MSPENFRSALAKGFGRTILALENSDSDRYADALLAGCTENLQYDRLCEDSRVAYFMRLLSLAGLMDQARVAILVALPQSEEGWDRDWMADLLGALAERGDEIAWTTLRDLAASGNENAQDALATTGEAGLSWVEDNVLPTIPKDERYRVGMWLPDEEGDDETETQRRLRKVYIEWDASREELRGAGRKPPLVARDFLRALDRNGASYIDAREFARTATRAQWRKAAERLLVERRDRPVRLLAKAFGGREFPLSLHRLFRLAANDERGWAVCRVLGTIESPQVRHFVRRLLRVRPLPWNAVEALTMSFRPGDEALVGEVLPAIESYGNDHRHNVVLDIVALFREHPEADWQRAAEWVYEHSPCSMCRGSAFDWLAEHGGVQPEMLAEALGDAESQTRKTALRLLSSL